MSLFVSPCVFSTITWTKNTRVCSRPSSMSRPTQLIPRPSPHSLLWWRNTSRTKRWVTDDCKSCGNSSQRYNDVQEETDQLMKWIKTYRQNHLLILNVYKFSHQIFYKSQGSSDPPPRPGTPLHGDMELRELRELLRADRSAVVSPSASFWCSISRIEWDALRQIQL